MVVIGSTFQELVLNLLKVFQRFRKTGLKLNPEKCQILPMEVINLGHIVSLEGITTDPEKLIAVREWPKTKNRHEIRGFLGLCMYYRLFISGYAKIAQPLTKLTEEKQTFQWTPEVETAFHMLKGALCVITILAHPQLGERFIFDRDASNVGIEGVLSQVQDRHERVIAYYSKTLNKAGRNYCVTRRELLP
jgi:hypothetical protein